uniref:trypsin n=1 Tax=Anoplopoma fimbria TaxID=229290 RepID=C3KJU3_ANOFI|nr:Granzyme BG,H precursor [Anoplopoma fimbria]
MFIHCDLLILTLVLTLDGRVHAGKIIGGSEAVPHSRPYMVLVERNWNNGSKAFCGGFLLNEDFVMTAAHCQASSYKISLGAHDVSKKNEIQIISVDQAFPRRDYNPANFRNDIMVLKLSSKARFSENVKPIALAGKGDANLPKSCSTSGWGATEKIKMYMSSVLREINVTLVDNEDCARANLYCAEGEAGVGHGDSGGPLVCEDKKAYGVVSTRFIPKSLSSAIQRFTQIPDQRSWIDSTMMKALKNYNN